MQTPMTCYGRYSFARWAQSGDPRHQSVCVGRDGAIRPALVVLRTVLALSGRDR
jgi:hypothetical protein